MKIHTGNARYGSGAADVMEKERIRLPFVSWFAYTMAIEFEAEKVKDQESFAFCAGTGTGQVRDPENPL